jgi:hypothetical protein
MSFNEQMHALLAGTDVAPSEWLDYYRKTQPQVFVRTPRTPRPRVLRVHVPQGSPAADRCVRG